MRGLSNSSLRWKGYYKEIDKDLTRLRVEIVSFEYIGINILIAWVGFHS